jgi:hypothetical protein
MDGVMQNQQQSPTTPSGQGQQSQQQQQQQQKVALITLPPPREVARPEMPRDSAPAAGRVDEEEWVTVFGYVASPLANSMECMCELLYNLLHWILIVAYSVLGVD